MVSPCLIIFRVSSTVDFVRFGFLKADLALGGCSPDGTGIVFILDTCTLSPLLDEVDDDDSLADWDGACEGLE